MALCVRKIRKGRWYRSDNMSWLPEGEVHADVLADLLTRDNALSIYCLDDDQSALDRLIAALAANCEHLSNIDYATFDQTILTEIGIRAKRALGDLPDDEVNGWHSDLYQLSASSVAQLARAINATAEIARKQQKAVLALVARSVAMGWIEYRRVKWKRSDLDALDRSIAAAAFGRPGSRTSRAP